MQTLKISSKNKIELDFIANFFKPFTKRVYLVGGSVRDAFLHKSLQDFDIEIYDLEPFFFDKLMQKLGAKGVGKNFFVYKYKNFDLALARIENKISSGHRGFEVRICDDEQSAAKRRDFTINSLMMNIFSGEILDFYGGLKDLERGILRHIDDKSFQEDSLRVLRAVHFVARFDLSIASESLVLMKSMDISDLNLDRINTELYKFFSADNLYLGYKALQNLNLEKKIFFFESRNEEFDNLLRVSRKFVKDEALFLYLYLNFFDLDKKTFFRKTRLKKEFFQKSEQFFLKDKPTDFELGKVALNLALKDWLGLWNEDRIQRAIELRFYKNEFKPNINVKELIQEGFSGEKLGEKILHLKEEKLKIYLKSLKEKQ